VQFGTISKFGLMEMSRQRLRPALSEGASIPCPRCGGSGHIRDTESSALQILRIIQEESLKDNTASVLCQVPVEVASFLLNEKRTEIAKIELKQRINVLMVPNKSLETPNYKLERLKHDDPRLDNITASYKMAEEVEDATAVTRRSQEPTNRQTPVIKGVLPDAPAPVAPVKPEPVAVPAPAAPALAASPAVIEKGFFGWMKNLFSATPAPAPVPQMPTPTAPTETRAPREGRPPRDNSRRNEPRADRPDGRSPRPDARGGRNDRGERGNRGERNNRTDRPAPARDRQEVQTNPNNPDAVVNEAGVSVATPDAGRAENKTERNNRNGNRGERRPPRNARPAEESRPESNDVTEDGANAPADAPVTESEGSSRSEAAPREKRSRDRYGRDRKSRNERGNLPDDGQSTLPLETPAAAITQDDAEPVQRKSYFSVPSTAAAADALSVTPEAAQPVPPGAEVSNADDLPVTVIAPANLAPPLRSLIRPADTSAVASPTPEAIAKAGVEAEPMNLVPAMPKVPPYALPLEALTQVAQNSGLTWVNSDAAKVAQVQAAIAAEPPSVHVPRQRPAASPQDERPLILVETKRDLRHIELPFERTESAQ
jgi:ribonuclease E